MVECCICDRLARVIGNASVVDVDDPPGMMGDIGIVGDEDNGDAIFFIESLEHGENFLARARV